MLDSGWLWSHINSLSIQCCTGHSFVLMMTPVLLVVLSTIWGKMPLTRRPYAGMHCQSLWPRLEPHEWSNTGESFNLLLLVALMALVKRSSLEKFFQTISRCHYKVFPKASPKMWYLVMKSLKRKHVALRMRIKSNDVFL